MEHRFIVIAASAFILLGAVTSAGAQNTTAQPPASPGTMGPGMMRHGGMMNSGMMGSRAMTGPGMRIIFALMDSDGDGTVSLQEF